MIQLSDTKEVMRGYFVNHLAIRKDLLIIEEFCEMQEKEQKEKLAGFLQWFNHHRDMLMLHDKGEEGYYFLQFTSRVKSSIESIEEFKKQSRIIDSVALGIQKFSQGEPTSSGLDELTRQLRTYVEFVRKRINDEEAIVVPLVMQNYTRDEYFAIERKYVRSFKLSQMPTFFSWISTKTSESEQDSGLPLVPAPIRWLLFYVWEPSYKKRFPDWIVGHPRTLPYQNTSALPGNGEGV